MPNLSDDLPRLQAGDTESLRRFIRRHHRAMAALAGIFLHDEAANAAVDAAWRDWIEDLPRLNSETDMAAALFGRLVARVQKTDAGRSVDLATMAAAEPDEPVLAAARFDPDQSWAQPMKAWDDLAADTTIDDKPLKDHLADAVLALPPPQRAVLVLRDMAQLPAATVATLLGIEAGRQAALLHRAHARLRRAIELKVGM